MNAGSDLILGEFYLDRWPWEKKLTAAARSLLYIGADLSLTGAISSDEMNSLWERSYCRHVALLTVTDRRRHYRLSKLTPTLIADVSLRPLLSRCQRTSSRWRIQNGHRNAMSVDSQLFLIRLCLDTSVVIINTDKSEVVFFFSDHQSHCQCWTWPALLFHLGTCESFFCVRIESRIESAVYTTHIPSVFILYLSRTRVMHATEYLLFISIQS